MTGGIKRRVVIVGVHVHLGSTIMLSCCTSKHIQTYPKALGPRVVIVGIHVHLGSTIKDVSIFSDLHRHVKQVANTLQCYISLILGQEKMTNLSPSLKSVLIVSQVLARNHEHFMHVKIINLGGGLGIDYTHKGLAPR